MQYTEVSPPVSPLFWRAILLALWCAATVTPSHAEHQHSSSEFEAFVATEAFTGNAENHSKDDDSVVNADLLLALAHDKFRVFGEYYITKEEHDLERFQIGYEFIPDTVLWVGRFHQPASAWNTEHHHGRYLQTAITRPSIEDWEDEQGLIPQHITGALLESRRPLGQDGGLQFAAAVGISPALREELYEPITLVGNNPGRHGTSVTARLAYLPEYAGTSSAGILYGHDRILVTNPRALTVLQSERISLSVYGAYADWNLGKWRLIGTLYYVDIALDGPQRDESFISAYVQAERLLPLDLTVFGRVEESARMTKSRYVSLFDDHSDDIDTSLRRFALGLRWDYARRQALTIEISRVVSLDDHAYEGRLQWSAAIP